MIDIYDEVGYIKEVLEHGFSARWMRDAALLIKHYKSYDPPYKKAKVKEMIKEKCKKYVPGYNEYTYFDKINKLVDNTWKNWKVDRENPENSSKLREIRFIEFPKEVLDWFLNLDQYTISTEEAEKLREYRGVSVKEQPITMERAKYLFTLFVWTKIQENYLGKPNVHYLKNFTKKFRQDANLKPGFSMKKERNLLYDLGFIYINHAIGVVTSFMESWEFKVPVTDENRIVLSGDDLYNCGHWLEKQKYGFYVCQRCGKEFANPPKKKTGPQRKYCPDCSYIMSHDVMDKKVVVCKDCGTVFEVPTNNVRTIRCKSCQEEIKKLRDRERIRLKRSLEKQ